MGRRDEDGRVGLHGMNRARARAGKDVASIVFLGWKAAASGGSWEG